MYIVPVYEDYYFINFHMGDKLSDAGLRTNLLTRRLVVFGQSTSATVRIGDVVGPSPDPAHQIFAGWETADFTDPSHPQSVVYYETLAADSSERDILHNGTAETAGASGSGYRIIITKAGSTLSALDLYPVFAEARWVYFNTGVSGNGAKYVGAQYRLTNDEDKGTTFTSFPTTTRPGYVFTGWYLSQENGNGTGIQITDANGAFVNAVKGQTFYAHYSTTTDPTSGNEVTVTTFDTDPANGTKVFEITAGGELYIYKALDSLTLYAGWAAETVDYTVVYWLENANDDDYTLMYYKVLQGVAGQQTAAGEAQTGDEFELNGTTYYPYTEYKLQFAHLSTDQDKDKDGNQSGIQQKSIAGDGSTIINVYYDRDVYTLRFDIGFARRTSTTGTTTSYASMTASEAAAYVGTVYGVVNGNYTALTPGNGGYTYPGTVTTRHDYTDERYQVTTGTTGTQYGVVNGNVVQLSVSVTYRGAQGRYTPATNNNGTQYGIYEGAIVQIYFNNNNNTWYRTRTGGGWGGYTYSNPYNGSRFTQGNNNNNIDYTGTVYYPGSGSFITETTYSTTPYGTNGTYYFPLTANNSITYNNGTNYGNGTRYLRVANDGDSSYTLGFVNGAMQNLSNDTQGWYYSTEDPTQVTYTGTLYKRDDMAGTWQFSVSNITSPNYEENNTWDEFLTQHRYDLGTTNPFGPDEYTGTYEQTVSGTLYKIYYYDLTAKYGENIMARYPGSQPVRRNGNTSYSFVGWLAQRDSYYNGRLATSIKGYFDTMTEDLILTGGTIPAYNSKINNINPNSYTAITVDDDNAYLSGRGLPEHNGITQEFRCRYTGLDGAKKYLYRIYLADVNTLAYPSEPTDKFVITAGSGSNPDIQTPPTYYGYTLVDTKVLAQNGTEQTPTSNNYSAYAIPELTAAGVGDGMIMVFRLQPNLHHINYKYGSGADPALINTEFGNAVDYYYNQSLANANVYNDAANAAIPEGYSFKGWYENPDGIGSRFNFNSTMPDGDIVLYAVYSPKRYRVTVNPDGAEIDHIDHTGASYVGTYNGIDYNFQPFVRAATSERARDSGYNRSQATYINGTYGETIDEYAVTRTHVPIGDVAAQTYTGRLYYYLNFQYNSTDGSGLPSDLRNALYVDVTPSTPGGPIDETELHALYNFFNTNTNTNYSLMPSSFTGMTAQNLSYEAWKALYIDKQEDDVTPQLYRKCNSKENWVFLGWFKNDESVPYNFNDPVTEAFSLTAKWRLDGGYTIQYTPEYWLYSEETHDTYMINGNMDTWTDPDPNAANGEFTYTDGAKTTIYKQPTHLTKNGAPVEDNSINFLGWRIVSVSTTEVNGQTVVTYSPMNPNLFDPGDDFYVDVQYADGNNVIHMQAVYEETVHSVHRPNVANLTLDANGGYLVDNDQNASELQNDKNLPWPGVGTVLMDADADQIIFGDVQANATVHLHKQCSQ